MSTIRSVDGLTPMEDKFCEFVAQGFSYGESARRAGYQGNDPAGFLLGRMVVLRAICDRIRIYKRETASVELLNKSKRKLNELMDSPDEKVVLGAAGTVLRTFSSPGGKTLMEKAVEEDKKVSDLTKLAKDLLPGIVIDVDATVIQEPAMLPEDAGGKEH